MINKTDKGMVEIDLLAVIRCLWKNAIVLVLVAALFATGAFAITIFFIKPQYEAKASLYVNNSTLSVGSTKLSISSSELSASNSLVDAYVYVLKSRTTMEQVIAETGISYTYEQLGQMVSTSSVNDTAAFEIVVTSQDPVEAELIANKFAEILPDRISEIIDGCSTRVIDYAIIPAHRSSPSYSKNVVIGALLGFVLAAAFVVIRNMLQESRNALVESSEELRKLYPDIPIIALIPDMRDASKKGYYYSSYYGKEAK